MDNEKDLAGFATVEELVEAYEKLQNELAEKESLIKVAEEQNKTPVYERDGWNEKVVAFIERNPSAEKYAAEIGRIVAEDDALSKAEDCLDKAFLKVLSLAVEQNEAREKSEEYKQKFLSLHPEIKDEIIEEYLQGFKEAPVVIAGGGRACVTPAKLPKTLSEAAEMAQKLLKNN